MAFGMDITEYHYKLQRDYKNTIDTAFDEGRKAGRKAAKLEIAKRMKQDDMPAHLIAHLTGLSEEEINRL